jgi:hypothetical protein
MGSHLISVNNGDCDTPSFHIDLAMLSDPRAEGALKRLKNWLEAGNCEIYELRFMMSSVSHESSDVWKKKVGEFVQSLSSALIELFSLSGTVNIRQDMYGKQEKLSTLILAGLAKSNCSTLERLCMSDCWVDGDTFAALAQVAGNSKLTALKLSGLHMGLVPLEAEQPPTQIDMVMRKAECNDYMRACCCLCKPTVCGLCCSGVPDYERTKEEVGKMLADAVEKYEYVTARRTGGDSLIKTFTAMKANGKVDTIEFSNSRLLEICGSTEMVNKVLQALSESMPTAVKIDQAGLLDNNVPGICDLFFENPDMAHLEVSIAPSDLDGIENLQNLIQTSPMLVSGALSMVDPFHVKIANEMDGAEESMDSACCFSWKVQTWSQATETMQIPLNPRPPEDFNIFRNKIEEEMKEHTVIPVYTVLSQQWRGNPKKLKNLVRASTCDFYRPVISQHADEPKIELCNRFLKDIAGNAGKAATVASLIDAVVEGMLEATDSAMEDSYAAIKAAIEGNASNESPSSPLVSKEETILPLEDAGTKVAELRVQEQEEPAQIEVLKAREQELLQYIEQLKQTKRTSSNLGTKEAKHAREQELLQQTAVLQQEQEVMHAREQELLQQIAILQQEQELLQAREQEHRKQRHRTWWNDCGCSSVSHPESREVVESREVSPRKPKERSPRSKRSPRSRRA